MPSGGARHLRTAPPPPAHRALHPACTNGVKQHRWNQLILGLRAVCQWAPYDAEMNPGSNTCAGGKARNTHTRPSSNMTRPAIFLSVHSSPGELSPQRRSTSSPLPSPAALTHSYHAPAPPRGGPIRSGPGVRVRKGDLSHLRLRAQRVPGTCSLSATPPLVRGELRREANVYPEREAIRPMISHLPRAGHGEGMPQQIPGLLAASVCRCVSEIPRRSVGPPS